MYKSGSLCLNCVFPCGNCTSSSFCTSCLADYLYNGSCVVSILCPTGTYANSTLMICQICDVQCSSCLNVGSNCTSCKSPYFYYSNLCVLSCPDGMYLNNSNCYSCVFPCANCTSVSYCTSCSIQYLLNGSCVPASNCTSTTYANSSTMVC
jgi:hypothetical protein